MDKDFDIKGNNEKTNEYISGRSFGGIVSNEENEVIKFYVRESILNNPLKILIAVCKNGKEYVVAGDHHAATYLKECDNSYDVNPNLK